MRRLNLLAAIACSALIATAAPAQETPTPSTSPSEVTNGGASTPAKPTKICRAGEAPDTGSRVASRRVCKTKEQWDKFDKRNRG